MRRKSGTSGTGDSQQGPCDLEIKKLGKVSRSRGKSNRFRRLAVKQNRVVWNRGPAKGSSGVAADNARTLPYHLHNDPVPYQFVWIHSRARSTVCSDPPRNARMIVVSNVPKTSVILTFQQECRCPKNIAVINRT